MSSLSYGYKAEEIVAEGRVNWDEINAIKEWNVTADVPELSDARVVGFILSCNRDLEFTKKTILEYFKVRLYAKELFNNRDLDNPEMQLQLDTLEYIEFPVKTGDGSIIIYHKLHDCTYWKYNMEASMRLLCMTLDAALYKYPPHGLIILFDMKGVSLMHLTRIKLSNIRAFFHYCQDGLPAKLKEIHVLNASYLLDKILTIVKPFMKKELFELLHFHRPDMCMEKFYKNHIDKSCLPSDYGGDLPSTRVLHELNTKYLRELKPFFDQEENIRNTYYKEG